MRLVAPESRIGQVKVETDKPEAAQVMPDTTLAKVVQAHTALQIKADAVNTATPQAQVPDSDLISIGSKPQDAEAAASAADLLKIQTGQPAMCAPGLDQVEPVDAASILEQSAQPVPVTNQQAADLPILTAATTLKRSETFAEEDDYDADD